MLALEGESPAVVVRLVGLDLYLSKLDENSIFRPNDPLSTGRDLSDDTVDA